MRQLVHYDLDDSPGPSQPSPKKRKHAHERGLHPSQIQHWDDPGNAQDTVVYDEQGENFSYENEGIEVEEGDGEEMEDSRELTHEEIWDDSALIDAWNSAEAEYATYHGKSKDWKNGSVKKSPLWYNVPHPQAATRKGPKAKPSTNSQTAVVEDEDNTAPIDFDTFVPTHDPSLPGVLEQPPSTFKHHKEPGFFSLPPSTSMVSRDEAFNNALSAMYWTGYWTAVYHSSKIDESVPHEGEVDDVDEGEEQGAEHAEAEDLVPAQR
ncbi:hypothetical protein SCLCIDRAFT_1164107 [Scleroderma citrinum Foug A]|uniref:Survival Motor Neuron Gemin2-binding domain-containing protein n=1 Tax=Scleroderma citrinum Foug A TaxID=1036808 RepID=A0A0C2YRL3_9AGAM|nr:hypothetical protein SCLCIDRAFT_1164107 [Scleroderma citrinum Foug A]